MKILTLDGGGIWGIVEALTLQKLFGANTPGQQILAQFDLAGGNSVGSIVLAGLAADFTPAELVAFFNEPEKRDSLFRYLSGFGGILGSWGIAPKYSTAAKLSGIQKLLGPKAATRLDTLPTKLFIPAFDIDRLRLKLFRSYQSPLDKSFPCTLAEASHASSTPPVLYFDGPAVLTSAVNSADIRRFYDGACGAANNPSMIAVTEAQALGQSDIRVLSLGTGLSWKPETYTINPATAYLFTKPANTDEFGAIQIMASAVMDEPPDLATKQAYYATGGKLVRVNPMISPVDQNGDWGLPAAYAGFVGGSPQSFETLFDLPMDALQQSQVDLLIQLTNAYLDDRIPNQPIVADGITNETVIGQSTFSEALKAWETLSA